MIDKELYVNEASGFSINYTNNKGFYIFLTKNLILINEFKLNDDYKMWFKAMDSFYMTTFPYWKEGDKATKLYKELYESIKTQFNKINKAHSQNIKGMFEGQLLELLRDMNEVLTRNTSHIMIKSSEIEDNDESEFLDWVMEQQKLEGDGGDKL